MDEWDYARGLVMEGACLDQILEAKELIVQGKLVAIPTETVYGLAASLFNESAIHEIFRVKGRPQDNPLIVHVSSLLQVEAIATEIPPSFYALVEKFWPGPLTCVLKKQPSISSSASAGLDSIAIRMPSHPIALELISEVGPLVAPSANLSGRPSPTSAAHVEQDLSGKIGAVLDGGECEIGIESTILSLLGEFPVLLRPGSITQEAIESLLQERVLLPEEGGKPLAPGMKYRHYAPDCPVILVDTEQKRDQWLAEKNGKWMSLSSCNLTSRNLYALLRQADQENYQGIVILCDPTLLANKALMNRLYKAASCF